MDPANEGQKRLGTPRASSKADQSEKTGGRSDMTDVLAGRQLAHRPFGPAPRQAPQSGGQPIDPPDALAGWVDGGNVSTPPVKDATIRPDGTPKVTVEGGSSRVDQPGRG